MGLSREHAGDRLPHLNALRLGVRIDRSGIRRWDYQTVGARTGLTMARGGLKTGAPGTMVTRREYLADASFLVALQGEPAMIEKVREALESPKWPVFLGRKSFPPTRPIFDGSVPCEDLPSAFRRRPWRPRCAGDERPAEDGVPCLIEWRPADAGDIAPADAEVWYDVPVSFDPPVHQPRFVVRESRLDADRNLCVLCKLPGPRMTVQHVTYRRAGGGKSLEDLGSLCRLCHDAVTMIEYGLGMGLDRIDPEQPRWRDKIIRKREEIIEIRSLETRRRRLAPEEVE